MGSATLLPPARVRMLSILSVSVMLLTLMPLHPIDVRASSNATLFVAPSSQALASSGGIVTYTVNVSNISPDAPLAGWAVYVWTNNSILNPVSISLGSFLAGPVEVTECINGFCTFGSPAGDDGPGVVHSEVVSGGSGNSGNGTLFTISYKAVAGPGTPLIPFSDTLFDASGAVIAHTTFRGSYGVARPDFHVVIANWLSMTGVYSVSVSAVNGFVGTITFSLAVPPDVTASVSPSSMVIDFPRTLSSPALLFVNPPSAAGNYTVQVTGSSGTLSHTEAVTVAVRDFMISADPNRVGPVDVGSTANSTITVVSLNHFAGTVSLVAISQPGLTATLSPTSVTGSGTSLLTVSASSAGNYSVQVWAYSGVYHTIIMTVGVVDFTLTANPDRFVPSREGSQIFKSSINLTSLQGFMGIVGLSLASPAGFQTSLSSTILPMVSGGSATATLTIRILGNVQPGTYAIVVTAKIRSLVHTITVLILVPSETTRV